MNVMAFAVSVTGLVSYAVVGVIAAIFPIAAATAVVVWTLRLMGVAL